MTLKAFTKLVRREVNIYAHKQQLYRAKRKALDQIHGDAKQQHHKLRKYCCFILEKNPCSAAIIQCEGALICRNPTFKRIFLMFAAQIQDFIGGFKPIIGLDACFLKGLFDGQLMAAIGKDGNNQISISVVETNPPELWCKFKMSDKPKCDMLSNNLSESFDNYIKEEREEPILSLLEMLRRQFMCRFQKKRDWIAKYNGNICHRIQSKLDQIKKNTLNFEAIFAGVGTWEILSGSNSFLSSLHHHTCSYREWQLTGISCVHATCAILTEHKSPEDFVSHYYYVSSYKLTYSFIIHPPEDVRKVEVLKEEIVMLPPFKRLPGKPKKLRKMGTDEINIGGRVTKRGSTMTCSKCGKSDHNIRTCKNPPRQFKIERSIGHTDVGRGRGTTTDVVGGRKVAAGASRETKTAVDSAATGRGRGRGRGPLSGTGNWNGIDMSTMQHFIPATELPPR
ncbi:UNVERIFIED_CONTAM: hypothetical protein Scaly_1167800 [Sesamum calycinum]|uniref:Zinc finger PMZ-type domain-containing protein n=1 Tax=Sesamum calycinum TaxID=2727403 RepID=A0AAW2Q2T8_9LAMI